MLLDDPSPLVRHALADALGVERATRRPRWCTRWSTTSRISPRSCWSARRCCSTPIWSIRSRSAAPTMQSAIARRALSAALGRRPRSPKSARAEACLTLIENAGADIAAVLARPHRGALRPSRGDPRSAARLARPAGRDPPCAGGQAVRDARRTSWSRATGWKRAGRSASRRKPARRRPSSSRRSRDARCRRWSAICARPASSPPAWCCARCSPATSTSSSRRWPNWPDLPAARVERAGARPPRRRLQGGLRARGPAGVGLSGVPRRDRGDARDGFMPSRAAPRGSSAAWSSACSRAAPACRPAMSSR